MTNFSSLASAAGLSGTQYKLRYEQSSCRLELTGLPDVTAAAALGSRSNSSTSSPAGTSTWARRPVFRANASISGPGQRRSALCAAAGERAALPTKRRQ